ncbi:MAG: hypothetical protein ACLSGB_16150 [Dorea sp.]
MTHLELLLKNNLKEEGIDTRYLVTEPGGESLHTYIVVDKSGEHFILANSGNCVMNLEKREIPDQLFEDIDLFYTRPSTSKGSSLYAAECYRREKFRLCIIFRIHHLDQVVAMT